MTFARAIAEEILPLLALSLFIGTIVVWSAIASGA